LDREFFTAQTPTPAQRLERLLIAFLRPAAFHPTLEFTPSRRRVFPNPVLAQQSVDTHPSRAMLRGRRVPPQAAPRVGHQPVIGGNEPGPDRIQMPMVANRSEVTAAIAIDLGRCGASCGPVLSSLIESQCEGRAQLFRDRGVLRRR
jgi:hypothetical protein